MSDSAQNTGASSGFSEKEFYLAEFRGRSLALVLADDAAAQSADVRSVLADFEPNRTRCLLISTNRAALSRLCGDEIVEASDPRWVGAIWHAFRAQSQVGLLAPKDGLAACSREAALHLRLAKLIWVEEVGPLRRTDGSRRSYVDLADLAGLIEQGHERKELLREIERMVHGGLASAAICAPDALDQELFTYAGAGTFFTRDRYIEVRRLGLDDFDMGHNLVQRGVEEGYLVARTEEQLEEVLTNAFGVFIERRYLAGIGALIPHAAANAGELGSLYTLTRFASSGVGAQLVNYAMSLAAERGFAYVYACTTQARVVRFFQTHGFDVVEPTSVPAEKWNNYPSERRDEVTCLRRDLA